MSILADIARREKKSSHLISRDVRVEREHSLRIPDRNEIILISVLLFRDVAKPVDTASLETSPDFERITTIYCVSKCVGDLFFR